MLKEITPLYQTITAGVMTGVAVLTSLVTAVTYKDTICMLLSWTSTAIGTFQVQGSVDYNPGSPQSGGTANAGTWINIPLADQNGIAPAAAGASGAILVNLEQVGFPYIRVQYTNSSSTGVLNTYVFGKSLG